MLSDLHPKLKKLIAQEDHGTILDGVFASSAIDTSGESLNVAGCDISSLNKDGQFNSEHLSPDDEQFRNAAKDKPGFWSTLVGRIDFAKKIFKEEDCESKRELELWKSLKLPFIYGWGELFDAEGHRNAKDIAAIVEHYAKRGLPIATRFSIEGSTIKRDGNELVKTCARRVAITVKPANHSATSNLIALADETKPYHQTLTKGEGPDSFISCIEQDSLAFLAKKQLDPNMGYKFSHEHHDLGGGKLMTKVNVHTPTGDHVGAATFMHQGANLVPGSVVVDDDHQRRGIGSSMYAHAEKLTGKKIVPSSNQTPEGAALWAGNAKTPQFGQLNKNIELEDLEKGIGGAIAGAMMAAAPMSAPKIAPPKPNIQHVQTQKESPKWTPDGLHKDLFPIAFLESSFGKNTHHEPNSHGEYNSAIGAVGLKISSAHDAYKKSHTLQTQYPDLQTPESFTQKIKSDPKFYNSVASQYWDTLKKRFKTPARTAFAWRWGWGNAAKADDSKVNTDPYVQKFLKLTAEHYAGPKSKAVVEHPVGGATHEPMAINTHDSMDKAETKNEKVPEDHVIGMEVPKGGSSCSKCKYVSQDGKKCGNEFFVKWNKGHVLPAPSDKYCCDFFEAKENLEKTLTLGSSNAAPGSLTGGAALAKEGMVEKKKKDLKTQVLAAYRDWPMSQPFKEFLKSRLPEVDDKIIDKFAEMADDLTVSKLNKTEGYALPDLKPPKGAVVYNNKYIIPGQVVLIGGPFEGSKLKLLAMDDNYIYVQPFKAGDQESVRVNKLNRNVEGTHFEILEVPQILKEKLPIYVHGQNHGDALNITARQQELIHGIDLASDPVLDNHMNGSTEARTKGIIGWFGSANGKVSYVKPSVMYEHDDLFGHPQEYLSTARREVVFHNLARDFFDLGEYVPVTACFKHPNTGVDHSACELIPNAAHVQMGSRDEIANDRLLHAGDSGVLDRLAIMDAIMGHADRHRLNYMTGPQNPNIFLIDNALIFNFSDHYIPSYLHDYYKFRGLDLAHQDLNQGAIEWLVSLDPFELGNDLEQNGVPKPVIEKCVARLLSMQSVAIEGKTKAFDILFAHASYVNSFKPQSLEDIAEQEGLM